MNFSNAICKNKDILFIFLITFVLFSAIQFSTENLAGNDSYLYIKLAEMTKNQGLMKEFPWLNATIMKDNFTGLHFLYYVLLVPFTFFGDLTLGAKLASLFFLAAMTAIFYAALKSLKLKYNFLWYLLLLSSSGYFLIRMNLARPLNFSVALSLLIFYALIKNNNLLLFLTSFLFVWAHGSFPLAVFLALIFTAVSYIRYRKMDYKPLSYSIGGIILALFINPFFPHNLKYFSIYYLNSAPYSLTSGIAEWQPIQLEDLMFSDAPLLFILFWVAVMLYILGKILKFAAKKTKIDAEPKEKITIDFLAAVSVMLFAATLLQGRFIDYWTPFSILFLALYFETLYAKLLLKNFFEGVKNRIKWPRFFSAAEKTKIVVIFLLFILIGMSIWSRANFVLHAQGADNANKNIQEIAEWLEKNTLEKSIVFNVNWGDFSKLFFYNSHNYYAMGLDPKFIYLVSPEKYWLYTHMGEGAVCEKEKCSGQRDGRSIYDIVKKEFNADYIFVSTTNKTFDYTNLINMLSLDSQFEKAYENDGGKIWKLRN